MKHVKGVLFFQNGIRKGKGMDLGAEPAHMKLCRVPLPPPSPLPPPPPETLLPLQYRQLHNTVALAVRCPY